MIYYTIWISKCSAICLNTFCIGLFSFSSTIPIAWVAWMERNESHVAWNFCVSYRTVVYFTDQNWISKIVYCIRMWWSVKYFPALNSQRGWRKPANARHFAVLLESMVITYYIKFFCPGPTDTTTTTFSMPSSRRNNQVGN